jgi:hypothetical protein
MASQFERSCDGQLALGEVSVRVLLILLAIIARHCCIFIHLSITDAIESWCP